MTAGTLSDDRQKGEAAVDGGGGGSGGDAGNFGDAGAY